MDTSDQNDFIVNHSQFIFLYQLLVASFKVWPLPLSIKCLAEIFSYERTFSFVNYNQVTYTSIFHLIQQKDTQYISFHLLFIQLYQHNICCF